MTVQSADIIAELASVARLFATNVGELVVLVAALLVMLLVVRTTSASRPIRSVILGGAALIVIGTGLAVGVSVASFLLRMSSLASGQRRRLPGHGRRQACERRRREPRLARNRWRTDPPGGPAGGGVILAFASIVLSALAQLALATVLAVVCGGRRRAPEAA